eukprot:3179549-Rhodomonas_salina.1
MSLTDQSSLAGRKNTWLKKSLHTGGVVVGHNTWSTGPRTARKMTSGSPNETSPMLRKYLTHITLDRRKNPPQRHGPNVGNWQFAACDALVISGTMRDHSSIREGENVSPLAHPSRSHTIASRDLSRDL